MHESLNERRMYKRADLRIHAEFSVMHFIPHCELSKSMRRIHPAETLNISEGGVQIMAQHNLEPGQVVRISLKTAEKDIYAYAAVRWSLYDWAIGKFRAGMEFYYLNEAERNKIRAIVN